MPIPRHRTSEEADKHCHPLTCEDDLQDAVLQHREDHFKEQIQHGKEVVSGGGVNCEDILQRMIRFTPGKDTWEIWQVINEEKLEEDQKHFSIGGIFDPELRASCPVCKTNVVVVHNGHKDGVRTYICRNQHDPCYLRSGNQTGHLHFSIDTSYEAMEYLCSKFLETARVFIKANPTYEELAALCEVPKYFVEMMVSMIAQGAREGTLTEVEEADIKDKLLVWQDREVIPVVIDFSGSGIRRGVGLLLSKIGDQVWFDITTTDNHSMSAWSMLRRLKLMIPEGILPTFITDGEPSFMEPIRSLFPEAIHIRQFHSEKSRGLVHVHFPHEDGIYTLACRWDLVLDDEDASDRTKNQRLRRATIKAKKEDEDKKKTEGDVRNERKKADDKDQGSWMDFPDHVALYDRDVKNPSRRRIIVRTSPSEQGEDQPRGMAVPDGPRDGAPIPPAVVSIEDPVEKSKQKGRKRQKKRRKKSKPLGIPRPRKIFEGTKEQALEHPIAGPIILLLVLLFGGRFITSNEAEEIFNVKQRLRQARCMKKGTDVLMARLWAYFVGRKLPHGDLTMALRKVFTSDALETFLLPRRRKPPEKSKMERKARFRVMLEREWALPVDDRGGLVIKYRDGRGYYSTRAIRVEEIHERTHNGDLEIHAYCLLRQSPRMFLLSRIEDMVAPDEITSLQFSLN